MSRLEVSTVNEKTNPHGLPVRQNIVGEKTDGLSDCHQPYQGLYLVTHFQRPQRCII